MIISNIYQTLLASLLITASMAIGSAQEEFSFPAPSPSSVPILERPATPTPAQPTYVALTPNINDFGRFADSGSDANWYVGFNNAWIVQLPQAPAGEYTRAFIGAKLGRAKTQAKSGRPWERESIHGKIYIAVSAIPAFTAEQSFFLTEASDIPLEPDPRAYINGTGQSQWFWAEVPVGMIDFQRPNYLIVWSPTEYLINASSSPILAAFEETSQDHGEGVRAWVNRSIQGVPPRRTTGTLETPIRHLAPALAIKLVSNNRNPITTQDCATRRAGRGILFTFSVTAKNAEMAWVERSRDGLEWERVSRYLRQPPYAVTLPADIVGMQGSYLRATAMDLLGNASSCDGTFISNNASIP